MTTITPTTPTFEQNRDLQIAAVINAVSKYYGVSARTVYKAFAPKNPVIVRARIIIWHHLQRSGMSFAAIGEKFGRLSADNVSRRTKYGILGITSEELLLLATLPKIETSLEITKA